MGRSSRDDRIGSWHHVMNRGIARRTAFENAGDMRFFLSRIAHAVRRREIEVHAFCLMMTHFHLLVRSPVGKLSEAMRRVQNEYVRHFNRIRGRDGPLFRGRFRSKLVDSMLYRQLLVRYIDFNPVSAGVVSNPFLYRHGSAHRYGRATGAPWLERSWIEQAVSAANGGETYSWRGYARTFGRPLERGLSDLVELRMTARRPAPDPLDDLLKATPREVVSWLRRKAKLADGTRPGLAVCDARSITEAIHSGLAERGSWYICPGNKRYDAWPQVHAGLLRDLAGFTGSQAGLLVSRSESGISQMRRRHRALMLNDATYARAVGQLGVDALRICRMSRAVE